MFDDFLKSDNQYTYRRLAELLFFLNYRDLRKRLVKERKDSKGIVKSILILLMNIVFNRIEKK